jgi:hypothetical protein
MICFWLNRFCFIRLFPHAAVPLYLNPKYFQELRSRNILSILKGTRRFLTSCDGAARLKVASVPGEICEYFRQFFSLKSRYNVSTFTTTALLLADMMFVIGRIWRLYMRSRSGSIAVGS